MTAKDKARSAPEVRRTGLTNAWVRQWTGMTSFAVHDAFAATLVEDPPRATVATDGVAPCSGQLPPHDATEHPAPSHGELLTAAVCA